MHAFGTRAAGHERSLQDFTGHDLSVEGYQGVHDMKARQYISGLGVFGGVDPLADHPDQIGLTPYNYTWNNPVNMTDPDGQFPIIGVLVRGGLVVARAARATRVVRGARAAQRGGRLATALADEGAAISHDFNTLTSASSTIGERAGALSDLVIGSWFNEANDASAAEDSDSQSTDVPINATPGARTEPVDLQEQLTLEEAKASGGEAYKGKLGDKKYDSENGSHDKRQHNHDHGDGTSTEVHFDRNRKTGEQSGHKIKDDTNASSRGHRYPKLNTGGN